MGLWCLRGALRGACVRQSMHTHTPAHAHACTPTPLTPQHDKRLKLEKGHSKKLSQLKKLARLRKRIGECGSLLAVKDTVGACTGVRAWGGGRGALCNSPA